MMLKQLFCLQVYNCTGRVFPRRFVLPLHISSDTATGHNLNTRPSSQATCVKTDKDTVRSGRAGGCQEGGGRRGRRNVSTVQSC